MPKSKAEYTEMLDYCEKRLAYFEKFITSGKTSKNQMAQIHFACKKMAAVMDEVHNDVHALVDPGMMGRLNAIKDSSVDFAKRMEKTAKYKIDGNTRNPHDFAERKHIVDTISGHVDKAINCDYYALTASIDGNKKLTTDLVRNDIISAAPVSNYDLAALKKLEKSVIKHCEKIVNGSAFIHAAKGHLKTYTDAISGERHSKDMEALVVSREHCVFIIEQLNLMQDKAKKNGNHRLIKKIDGLISGFQNQQERAEDKIARMIESKVDRYDTLINAYLKTVRDTKHHSKDMLTKIDGNAVEILKEFERFQKALEGRSDALSRGQMKKIATVQSVVSTTQDQLNIAYASKESRQANRAEKNKEAKEFLAAAQPGRHFRR